MYVSLNLIQGKSILVRAGEGSGYRESAVFLFVFFVCFLTPDTCQGVCMHHNPVVTTIATPPVTATMKERTTFNIADPTYSSTGMQGYMYL